MKREERKLKEYKAAMIRTTCSVLMSVINLVAFILTLLIYHRVYFAGGN